MNDKIREAIRFITSLRIIDNYVLLSQKEIVARNTKLNNLAFMLDKLGKFENMWKDFKSAYGHRTTYNSPGDQQLSKLENIMDKAEVAFLGSRPETRKEKFTDVIQRVYNCYIYKKDEYNKERDAIIKSLVELRDEEENE